MQTKECKKCGRELYIKATRCPICGTDQRGFVCRHQKIIGIILFIVILSGISGFKYLKQNEIIFKDTEANQESKVDRYEEALSEAKLYSEDLHFSENAVERHLNEEGFSERTIRQVMYVLNVDWKENALKIAREYKLNGMDEKEIGLKLSSEHGGDFSDEEVQYALTHLHEE